MDDFKTIIPWEVECYFGPNLGHKNIVCVKKCF
jgi:hypothetical protein